MDGTLPAPVLHHLLGGPPLLADTAAHLTATTTVPMLLAAIQADVLIRCFVIALVVVSPLWLHRRRRSRRARRVEDPGSDDDALTSAGPRLEDVIASIDDLASKAATDGSATLSIPTGVTIDGSAVDAATADALVRDALRRGGLMAVAEIDSPAGRTLECRPIGSSTR